MADWRRIWITPVEKQAPKRGRVPRDHDAWRRAAFAELEAAAAERERCAKIAEGYDQAPPGEPSTARAIAAAIRNKD